MRHGIKLTKGAQSWQAHYDLMVSRATACTGSGVLGRRSFANIEEPGYKYCQ